jgi:cytochrome c biogenesis protein CcmG/thiol:disulfide interchange protein DsbE
MPGMPKAPSRDRAVAACRAMWRHKIATMVTAAGLALAVAATVIGAPGHPHGAAPLVPGFTLPALGHPSEDVSLAAYPGRPVVVNFFASWCVPCKKETPLLARFFRIPRGRVVMIGVDVNDVTAAALSFVRKAGVTYPVGVDRTAATAIAWRVVAIPQTFFLDSRRRVIRRVFGAITVAELTRDTAGLAAAPGGRPAGSPAAAARTRHQPPGELPVTYYRFT